jgi:hypothetical protein
MKLQKQLAMKKAGKAYYKWVVNLPAETVELMGWREGTELTVETKTDRVVLRAGTS